MLVENSAPARIYVTRRLPEQVERRLEHDFDTTINKTGLPLQREALGQVLRDYDIVCPTITDQIDAALLSAGNVRARLLANFGAGVEHIDRRTATKLGLKVSNTPNALTETTAELALTLILMVMRRAGEGERELRAGDWSGWHPRHMLGRSLSGKTLGLLGFGRIARALAQRAAAMGMKVIFYTRTPTSAPGCEMVESIDELAARSDVLSIHVPGGKSTRNIVDASVFSKMKRDAVLINTARGSVVDQLALVDALRSGQIGGAGLDVYNDEPSVPEELLSLPHVVLLPHLGSATQECRVAMGMQMFDNIDAFLNGRELPNPVTA